MLLSTKKQILNNIRDKMDKTDFQKDMKYLENNINNSDKNYYYNKKIQIIQIIINFPWEKIVALRNKVLIMVKIDNFKIINIIIMKWKLIFQN